MSKRIPYLKSSDIKPMASRFLKRYYPSNGISVDVEGIIETMDIDLVVIPNLENRLGFDSYITSDFTKIIIDEGCFMNQESRARFSLAHELGHFELHRNLYENSKIQSEENYINFIKNLTDKEHRSLEIQAHIFAGFILLPPIAFEQKLKEIEDEYKESNPITVNDLPAILKNLSREFFVTQQVIQHQLAYEYLEWARKVMGVPPPEKY